MNDEQECVKHSEVFRGHLEECLEHLSGCIETHAPAGGKETAKQTIADFCDVTNVTVKGWLKGNTCAGETKIRLMCYLTLMGYYVLEMEKTKQPQKCIVELIGYGLLTAEQATELCGYTARNHLFDFLFGRTGTRSDREERMWAILEERKTELAHVKQALSQRYQLNFSLTDAVEERKASAILCIMEGLLAMLKSQGADDVLINSLQDMSPEKKKTLMRLSDTLQDLSIRLARQGQPAEGNND